MNQAPTVLAIGSCRIFRPIRQIHKAGLVRLANYLDRFWFTHTSGAAKQYVDVLDGRAKIPLGLRDAAIEGELEWPRDMHLGVPKADIAIVEISSLSALSVGGVQLNAHKVYRAAKELGIDPKPLLRGVPDALPENYHLKDIEYHKVPESELAQDLLYIRNTIGIPVITVDHLYSLRPNGEPAPERRALSAALEAIQAEHNIPFTPTRPLIEKHGSATALLDQNHYRKEFEITVGKSLLDSIRYATVP